MLLYSQKNMMEKKLIINKATKEIGAYENEQKSYYWNGINSYSKEDWYKFDFNVYLNEVEQL